MSVDTAQYVGLLNEAIPAAGDAVSEGDDNLRNAKLAMRQSFPSVTGAVTATHTELSYVAGVTSAIQTQLNAKAPLASPAFTGNPTAPTQGPSDNSDKLATTAFVVARAFASTLPAIGSGTTDLALINNGISATWGSPGLTPELLYYASM